jgi:hypothetical protein
MEGYYSISTGEIPVNHMAYCRPSTSQLAPGIYKFDSLLLITTPQSLTPNNSLLATFAP